MSAFRLASLVCLCVTGSQSAAAQDVVVRGRERGVEPPPWIMRELALDSTAFEFKRAWKGKLEGIIDRRAQAERRGVNTDTLTREAASNLGTVMTGIFRLPVIPFLFADSATPPYRTAVLHTRLFAKNRGDTATLASYYDEVSRGMFRVTGRVLDWVPTTRVSIDAASGPPGLGATLREVLDSADKVVNFKAFDRDHNGYVDLVAFVHPLEGGECGDSTRIWSHKWRFGSATGDTVPYRTNDGVFISDYIIQPAFDCDTSSPIEFGVFAHELGHGLGLPDLYSTGTEYTNMGIGKWGLMGFGGENVPNSPAYLEAWSRAELGWLRVTTVNTPRTVTLPPINQTGLAVRIDIPNSQGEYFLLENRQRIGSDRHLLAPGLLVWHVDSAIIAAHYDANTVQNNASRRGVTLIEADGRRDLDAKSGFGDDSDPFPGSAGVTEITPLSVPASSGHSGPSGISLRSIRMVGQNVVFEVSFDPVLASDAMQPQPGMGPFAVLRYSGRLTLEDTANLTRKGFRVLRVFEESNSVYVQVPATLSGPLSRVSPKLTGISTQMRPPRPPRDSVPAQKRP
jgi:M6 family metalloprotease-like protein